TDKDEKIQKFVENFRNKSEDEIDKEIKDFEEHVNNFGESIAYSDDPNARARESEQLKELRKELSYMKAAKEVINSENNKDKESFSLEDSIKEHNDEIENFITNEANSLTKDDIESLLNKHYEKVENLLEEHLKQNQKLPLSVRYEQFQQKLKDSVNEFKESVKSRMQELKDKLSNNIEEKKEDIKSFTHTKIEQLASHINDKLKNASKNIDERFLNKKENENDVKENEFSDSSVQKELRKIDDKDEKLSIRDKKLDKFLQNDFAQKVVTEIRKNEALLGSSLDAYVKSAAASQINNLQKDLSNITRSLSPQEEQTQKSKITSIEGRLNKAKEKTVDLKEESSEKQVEEKQKENENEIESTRSTRSRSKSYEISHER
ncbi:hypothetical protein, partial [Priestia megaterium]|uniref:hypothetical protein n=1 Tax=Priestia megaterium TaxID=1404 RepID=UPI002FFE5039